MTRTKEGKASDAIRDALKYEPGLVLYRNSVGFFNKNGCSMRAGLGNGSADFIGSVKVTMGPPGPGKAPATIGRSIALEIKAPGEPRFTLAELREQSLKYAAKTKLPSALQHLMDQALWAHKWRLDGGGFYAIVSTVDEARAAIQRAREGSS